MVVDSGWNRFGAHVHLMCSHGFHFLFKCSEKDLLFLLLTVRLVFVVAIFECMNGTPECITWTDRRTDGTIDSLSIFHGSDIQKCTKERTKDYMQTVMQKIVVIFSSICLKDERRILSTTINPNRKRVGRCCTVVGMKEVSIV